jgi:hypothetical protein
MKVADGVILSTEVLHMAEGSERVSLLDIYLANPAVRPGIVLAHHGLISPDEMVSSMANRSGALADINGDFYELNDPGRPIGMLMINGRLLQSPTVFAVLGVTSQQRLTITCKVYAFAKMQAMVAGTKIVRREIGGEIE